MIKTVVTKHRVKIKPCEGCYDWYHKRWSISGDIYWSDGEYLQPEIYREIGWINHSKDLMDAISIEMNVKNYNYNEPGVRNDLEYDEGPLLISKESNV